MQAKEKGSDFSRLERDTYPQEGEGSPDLMCRTHPSMPPVFLIRKSPA